MVDDVHLELAEKDTGVLLYEPYELCDQLDLMTPAVIVIRQIIEAAP